MAYLPNPRKEADENELVVRNDQFLALGLEPTTLAAGLLSEVVEVAKKYAYRIDRKRVPAVSAVDQGDREADRAGSGGARAEERLTGGAWRATLRAMNQHAPTVRRPATYQDVLDAPEHMVAELIDGALHLHPRPSFLHGQAASSLGDELVSPFQKGRGGPGGWRILDEPELHLGEDVLVPDLAGWRRERMPELPSEHWTSIVPDWVCEVLSPSTRSVDLTDKRRIYAGAGVGHLWLIDPEARTLEAFALCVGALDADRGAEGGRRGAGGSVRRDLVLPVGPLGRLTEPDARRCDSRPTG